MVDFKYNPSLKLAKLLKVNKLRDETTHALLDTKYKRLMVTDGTIMVLMEYPKNTGNFDLLVEDEEFTNDIIYIPQEVLAEYEYVVKNKYLDDVRIRISEGIATIISVNSNGEAVQRSDRFFVEYRSRLQFNRLLRVYDSKGDTVALKFGFSYEVLKRLVETLKVTQNKINGNIEMILELPEELFSGKFDVEKLAYQRPVRLDSFGVGGLIMPVRMPLEDSDEETYKII